MDEAEKMEEKLTEIEQNLDEIKSLLDKRNELRQRLNDIATIKNNFEVDQIDLTIEAVGKVDDFAKIHTQIALSGKNYDYSPGDLEYSVFKILGDIHEDLIRRINELEELIVKAWNEK